MKKNDTRKSFDILSFSLILTIFLFIGCGEAPYAIISPTNDAPIADNKSVTVVENSANNSITLTGNDADGDTLTYTIDTAPTNGTVTITDNIVLYSPTANYNGTDSFTYKANDGTIDSEIVIVSITVTSINDTPTADSKSITVVEDSTNNSITLSGTDLDGDTLTYTIDTSPTNGTVTITDNIASYSPNPNYNGVDSFTYKANDGTIDSETVTVSITVTSINDAPTVDAGMDLSIQVGDSYSPSPTSSDIDGSISTEWKEGSTTLTFPKTDFTVGTHTLTITVTDNQGATATDTLTLTVHSAPSILGSINGIGHASKVTLSSDGDTAYVASNNGLHIINITDPALPTFLGTLSASGSVRGITLSSDSPIAYVLDLDGLKIINISDHTNPEILGSITLIYSYEVVLSPDGNTAYVASKSGLKVIDISNYANPTLSGTLSTPGTTKGITLSSDGNTAYVVSDTGLYIIDIASLSISGSTSGSSQGITLSSNGLIAYMASGYAGLQIIDISDSANPALLGSVDTTSHASEVVLSPDGNTAYVADNTAGLQTIDISDSANPILSIRIPAVGTNPHSGVTLSPDGTIAYVANGNNGLTIIGYFY